MKTVVVLSDSHYRGAVRKLEPLFAENDFILHLGDGSGEMRPVLDEYPDKVRVCRGNCDAFSGKMNSSLRRRGSPSSAATGTSTASSTI